MDETGTLTRIEQRMNLGNTATELTMIAFSLCAAMSPDG